MRNINLRNSVLPASLLAILMAAGATGCSTGSGAGGAAGTSGSAGSATTTGAAGAGAGAAGSTGAGNSAGTAGAGAGTAGSTGAGNAPGTAGDTGTAGATAATGTGGAPPTTGKCADTGTRALTLDQGKIDDFEETAILPGWSSFNDVQPVSNAFKIMQEAGGALMTGHFGHYMGTGAKTPVLGGYGVGTIYNMAIDTMAVPPIYCVDVTAFDGVTFWAKAATMGAHVGVNFVVPETNMPDGDCTTACFNHPQKLISLTTDWAQYHVTFAEAMGQTGAKVKGRIQEVLFLSPDATWDFSIDELQLYKGTPPTTAVGGNSTM